MWVAELRVWHEGALQIELSKTLDVSVASYYLNAYRHGRREYILKVLTASGRDKQKFIDAFVKDPRAVHVHVDGDQMYFSIAPNNIFHNAVLDKSIFFTKPIITKNGFEFWTVASWEKQSIQKLVQRIRRSRRFAKVKLLSLSQRSLNFFIPAMLGELTEKQRDAVELAFQNGYYIYPRQKSVEELAGIARVPRATFQEHLRKAEAKILPAILEQVSFGLNAAKKQAKGGLTSQKPQKA